MLSIFFRDFHAEWKHQIKENSKIKYWIMFWSGENENLKTRKTKQNKIIRNNTMKKIYWIIEWVGLKFYYNALKKTRVGGVLFSVRVTWSLYFLSFALFMVHYDISP